MIAALRLAMSFERAHGAGAATTGPSNYTSMCTGATFSAKKAATICSLNSLEMMRWMRLSRSLL